LKVRIWAVKITKRKERNMPRKRYTPEQIINSLKGSRSTHKPGKHNWPGCKTPGSIRTDLLRMEEAILGNED